MILGKTYEEEARRFVAEHPGTSLGSLTTSGLRRVLTAHSGEQLRRLADLFAGIAVEISKAEMAPVVASVPVCDYRGSQRKTCCGSPDIWICKHLQTNCVATATDAARLKEMVATTEAQEIAICESCPHRRSQGTEFRVVPMSTESIAVVIPCHNYARFLEDCLQSIIWQTLQPTQIIVVDDLSTDDPKSVCDRFPQVRYERCEAGDVHQARSHGLRFVQSTFVCFLDADDKLPSGYFEEAIRLFREDRRIAITYPQLEYFGDATGPAHGTERAPGELRADDIEQRNWVSAGSVIRAEIVRQSLAFQRSINPTKNWSQDWHLAKAVLRSGNWTARKMATPLLYRKHGSNMSSRPNSSYWDDADLGNETVTIVIAFSGRWRCWARLRNWLNAQSWPLNLVRLLIMNAAHYPLTAKMLGLEDWRGGLQIERIDAGYPRLADQERRNAIQVGKQVEAAVASVYNRAITLLGTEYVVFIEDDVIPHDLDLIEKFFRRMGPWVAGISGVYRQRYQSNKCCAFDIPYEGDHSFKPLAGEGIEAVDGTGFGCLMTRRSLLRRFPLSGDGPDKFFDVAFCAAVKRIDNGWWQWLLHRGIQADHLLVGDDQIPSETDAAMAVSG